MGCIAYLPCGGYYTMSHIFGTQCVVYYTVDTWRSGMVLPVICYRNVVTYIHHQINMCVTHFAEAPVTLWLRTQHLTLCLPLSGRVPHFASPLLLFIRWCTLLYMFDCDSLSLSTIQSSLQIHHLLLPVLHHYCILQVWNILSNLHTHKYYTLNL